MTKILKNPGPQGIRATCLLLKLLGLKREKPQTKPGRIVRRCEYAVTALAVVYLVLQLFPQVLFAHSVQAHGIQLYSREQVGGDAEAILTAVRSRIAGSTLHRDDQRFAVFICNSKLIYVLFAPLNRGSFAITNPLTQRIFVADADLSRNQSRRFAPDFNVRSFTGVVSHEMGHLLLRRGFGFRMNRRLPAWLKEGYCEMLAGESSFPEASGDSLLADNGGNDSKSFSYFTYRRMVEYLIQEEKLTIEDLVGETPDEEEVRRKTCDWIRSK